MKKHLIALAVAGAVSVPAMAQNVTISGLLDTGIGNDSITQNVTTRKTSFTGLNSRNTTSVVNMQATEDLGGGMRATAFANQQIDSATGAFTARDVWAAISGGFGELKIGRYTPAFETTVGGYSQGGGTSLTAGTADFMFGSAAQIAVGAVAGDLTITAGPQSVFTEIGRSNSGAGQVQFTTPSFNGLTASVGHMKASNDPSTGASSTARSQSEMSVNFVSGPVSIGGGILRGNSSTEAAAAAERDIDMLGIGASVNLDGIILRVGHVQRSEDLAVGGTPVVDADITSVGVTIPLSGAVIAYATAFSGSDGANGTNQLQRDMTGYQLGAQYNLSKRTNVYAIYGQNEFQGQTVATTSKITGTSVGLRHSF